MGMDVSGETGVYWRQEMWGRYYHMLLYTSWTFKSEEIF